MSKTKITLFACACVVFLGVAVPASAQTSGTLYYSDTFDRDADTFVPPWDKLDAAAPDRVTTVPFARKGGYSAQFETYDTDLFGYSDPRSQVNKYGLFCEGNERYVGWSTYLPPDWPTTQPSWENMMQIGYTGYTLPPMHFDPENNYTMTLRDQKGNARWRGVSTPGAWEDFVMHVKFSKNSSTGYVELWVNGALQTMTNGATRIYFNTLNSKDTRCGGLMANNYRGNAWTGYSILNHDEIKVGDSYAVVDPAA